VSENITSPINYRSDTVYIEKIYCGKALEIIFLIAQGYWGQ
jgi:hypothetical protein